MNCLGGACTCGQHTRAASLLAAGGVANVRLVSVLVDAKGNELAIVPPRLIPIDLTKASARAAEGLGNIYNAIVSFAMSHSWEGTTSVLKPHRASGKCVAGCGKERCVHLDCAETRLVCSYDAFDFKALKNGVATSPSSSSTALIWPPKNIFWRSPSTGPASVLVWDRVAGRKAAA